MLDFFTHSVMSKSCQCVPCYFFSEATNENTLMVFGDGGCPRSRLNIVACLHFLYFQSFYPFTREFKFNRSAVLKIHG